MSSTNYKDSRTLKKLYIERKLSIREIAIIFKVNSRTIWYWLIKHKIPRRKPPMVVKEAGITKKELEDQRLKYTKKPFSGNLSEKAYLLGLRIGDLEVRKEGKLIRVRVTSSKKDQINMFKNLFEKYSKVNTYSSIIQGKKEKTAYVQLDNSFNFLVKKLKKKSKMDNES